MERFNDVPPEMSNSPRLTEMWLTPRSANSPRGFRGSAKSAIQARCLPIHPTRGQCRPFKHTQIDKPSKSAIARTLSSNFAPDYLQVAPDPTIPIHGAPPERPEHLVQIKIHPVSRLPFHPIPPLLQKLGSKLGSAAIHAIEPCFKLGRILDRRPRVFVLSPFALYILKRSGHISYCHPLDTLRFIGTSSRIAADPHIGPPQRPAPALPPEDAIGNNSDAWLFIEFDGGAASLQFADATVAGAIAVAIVRARAAIFGALLAGADVDDSCSIGYLKAIKIGSSVEPVYLEPLDVTAQLSPRSRGQQEAPGGFVQRPTPSMYDPLSPTSPTVGAPPDTTQTAAGGRDYDAGGSEGSFTTMRPPPDAAPSSTRERGERGERGERSRGDKPRERLVPGAASPRSLRYAGTVDPGILAGAMVGVTLDARDIEFSKRLAGMARVLAQARCSAVSTPIYYTVPPSALYWGALFAMLDHIEFIGVRPPPPTGVRFKPMLLPRACIASLNDILAAIGAPVVPSSVQGITFVPRYRPHPDDPDGSAVLYELSRLSSCRPGSSQCYPAAHTLSRNGALGGTLPSHGAWLGGATVASPTRRVAFDDAGFVPASPGADWGPHVGHEDDLRRIQDLHMRGNGGPSGTVDGDGVPPLSSPPWGRFGRGRDAADAAARGDATADGHGGGPSTKSVITVDPMSVVDHIVSEGATGASIRDALHALRVAAEHTNRLARMDVDGAVAALPDSTADMSRFDIEHFATGGVGTLSLPAGAALSALDDGGDGRGDGDRDAADGAAPRGTPWDPEGLDATGRDATRFTSRGTSEPRSEGAATHCVAEAAAPPRASGNAALAAQRALAASFPLPLSAAGSNRDGLPAGGPLGLVGDVVLDLRPDKAAASEFLGAPWGSAKWRAARDAAFAAQAAADALDAMSGSGVRPGAVFTRPATARDAGGYPTHRPLDGDGLALGAAHAADPRDPSVVRAAAERAAAAAAAARYAMEEAEAAQRELDGLRHHHCTAGLPPRGAPAGAAARGVDPIMYLTPGTPTPRQLPAHGRHEPWAPPPTPPAGGLDDDGATPQWSVLAREPRGDGFAPRPADVLPPNPLNPWAAAAAADSAARAAAPSGLPIPFSNAYPYGAAAPRIGREAGAGSTAAGLGGLGAGLTGVPGGPWLHAAAKDVAPRRGRGVDDSRPPPPGGRYGGGAPPPSFVSADRLAAIGISALRSPRG